MTTVTVYRSTDTSAPALSGSVGALITVLDAVLVNGYGTQPAAGWTKPFSGTNKATYRMSTIDGTGFYLSVDDAGPVTAKEAMMTGFEVVTAQGVGTGQFPTSALLNLGTSPAGAVTCRKSTTADGTARAWTIIADDTCLYFFPETGDVTTPILPYPFMFGDIFSYKSSDAYRCMIIGKNATNTGDQSSVGFGALLSPSTTFLSNTIIGHYMARSWTGVGGALTVGKHIDQTKMGAQTGAAGATGCSGVSALPQNLSIAIGLDTGATSLFPYPNGPDGGLYMSPIWVHHSNAVRGYLKGLWAPLHDRPLNHGDTFSGTGTMSGKTFICLNYVAGGNNGALNLQGQIIVETSSTWS